MPLRIVSLPQPGVSDEPRRRPAVIFLHATGRSHASDVSCEKDGAVELGNQCRKPDIRHHVFQWSVAIMLSDEAAL